MDHEEELVRLEQIVEKLLESYNVLKSDCANLQQRLQAKEKENKTLLEQVQSLSSDKSTMHNRVTGLIGKIEAWEESQKRKKNTGTSANKAAEENGSGESLPIFS